jgi:hypothetical protein
MFCVFSAGKSAHFLQIHVIFAFSSKPYLGICTTFFPNRHLHRCNAKHKAERSDAERGGSRRYLRIIDETTGYTSHSLGSERPWSYCHLCDSYHWSNSCCFSSLPSSLQFNFSCPKESEFHIIYAENLSPSLFLPTPLGPRGLLAFVHRTRMKHFIGSLCATAV